MIKLFKNLFKKSNRKLVSNFELKLDKHMTKHKDDKYLYVNMATLRLLRTSPNFYVSTDVDENTKTIWNFNGLGVMLDNVLKDNQFYTRWFHENNKRGLQKSHRSTL